MRRPVVGSGGLPNEGEVEKEMPDLYCTERIAVLPVLECKQSTCRVD